jgi:hypothetical protein
MNPDREFDSLNRDTGKKTFLDKLNKDKEERKQLIFKTNSALLIQKVFRRFSLI